jgi:hypothetical protein
MTGKSAIAALRRPRRAAEARLAQLRKAGRSIRSGCAPRTLRTPTRWPSRITAR